MAYGTVNADVIGTSVSGSNLGAGNASIMKNRIINGANVISQRGTSFSLTTGVRSVTTDRWSAYVVTSGATATVSQSTSAPVGFNNSLLYTVGTGAALGSTDFNCVYQKIEGYNVADMGFGTANAKTFTLSFWAKSSITGTYGVTFRNDAGDRSYGATYTISAANTWEYKSVTVVGDTSGTWTTDNSCGLMVTFGVGVGSTYSISAGSWQSAGGWGVTGATNIVATSGATWSITGVQLEVGSSATGYEYRQYGNELELCQRYYEILKKGDATECLVGIGYGYLGTSAFMNYPYKVQKRAIPTITFVGTASDFQVLNSSGWTGVSSVTSATPNIQTARLRGSVTAVAANNSTEFRIEGTSYFDISAEL